MVADGGEEPGLGEGQQAMEGGPSGRVGGRAEGRRAMGQGPEAAAQKDLTWLHLGPGVGGASGQRKPERWGAERGFQAAHYPKLLQATSLFLKWLSPPSRPSWEK